MTLKHVQKAAHLSRFFLASLSIPISGVSLWQHLVKKPTLYQQVRLLPTKFKLELINKENSSECRRYLMCVHPKHRLEFRIYISLQPMLRIRDVSPGSWIQQLQQKEEGKKIVVLPFLCQLIKEFFYPNKLSLSSQKCGLVIRDPEKT